MAWLRKAIQHQEVRSMHETATKMMKITADSVHESHTFEMDV